MSITIAEKSPQDPDGRRAMIDMTLGDTPLSAEMSDSQRDRFLIQVSQEWTHYHGELFQWRSKMEKWEHMSEMNYADRIGTPDPNSADPVPDIFTYENGSLGMSEGFVDFAAAQAKDDVFGTKPWLAATPQGRQDAILADKISKHAQWKLDDSDLEDSVSDAIRIACWGGTAFLKSRWERETETFKSMPEPAAFSKSTGELILSETGDMIHTAEELEAMEWDGEDVEWKDQSAEETLTVYDNSKTDCLDYRDVAFNPKAKELDLAYTPFYSRLRMGILDVIERYNIPPERHAELELALVGANEEARTERGEGADLQYGDDSLESNRTISLVEGFRRFKSPVTDKLIRVHCVFSPDLNILFKIDYLANETPGGLLPVFPVRVGKIPRRIFGIGYFEKYEMANNDVDRHHNTVVYRNKLAANVITGIHPDALAKPMSGAVNLNQREPFELAIDKKLADFIEFAAFPDLNQRSVDLMNQMLQMAQMRSGITSAAQGELKGVPNASTATGVNQLTSRGALLLKDPISQMTKDIRSLVEYNVNLLYENQNRDETFVWGEGEASELLEIVAGDVRGLRMNVTLKLVQSQNQSKLANAQAGIGILANYSSLPETDKVAARALYVQALESLGFNQAEDLVRQAVVDPAGILAIVPPEIAPMIQMALEQAGLIAPVEAGGEGPDGGGSAPVSEAA